MGLVQDFKSKRYSEFDKKFKNMFMEKFIKHPVIQNYTRIKDSYDNIKKQFSQVIKKAETL